MSDIERLLVKIEADKRGFERALVRTRIAFLRMSLSTATSPFTRLRLRFRIWRLERSQ